MPPSGVAANVTAGADDLAASGATPTAASVARSNSVSDRHGGMIAIVLKEERMVLKRFGTHAAILACALVTALEGMLGPPFAETK